MNLGVERFLISEFWPWAPTWCGFKESWGGVKSSQAPAPHQINAPNPSPLTGFPSHLPSWEGTDFSTLFKIWGQTKFQIPFCFPRIVLLVLVLGGFFGPPWTTLGSNFIYKHTEKHQNSHFEIIQFFHVNLPGWVSELWSIWAFFPDFRASLSNHLPMERVPRLNQLKRPSNATK